MTKRFTIKSQDDYFGVVDNNTDDEVCVVNGIRTEIEAEWLIELLNLLDCENEQLKQSNKGLQSELQIFKEDIKHSNIIINKLNDENEQLKQENKRLHTEWRMQKKIIETYGKRVNR